MATLIPSQVVYWEGETVRVTLPPLPSGQTEYVAISLPDKTTWVLSGFNDFIPFDNVNLPEWQHGETAFKKSVTADIPSGEYTLYLLRIPIGVEPLSVELAQWALGIKKILIKPLCEK